MGKGKRKTDGGGRFDSGFTREKRKTKRKNKVMAAARSGRNLISFLDPEIRKEREQRAIERDPKRRRLTQEQEAKEVKQGVEVQKSKEKILKLAQMRDREMERLRFMLHHEENAHLGECIALQGKNDINDNDHNDNTIDNDYNEGEE